MTSPTVAVVTGAARGLGLEFAHQLAAAGHQVLLTDVDGDAVAAAAEAVGHGAWSMPLDVTDQAGHRSVAEEAQRRGRLAVWVNNAGVLFAGDAWEQTDAQVAAIIDINVRGVFAGSRAAVEAMSAGGGKILNVASISALTPVPGLAMYAATKAAVLSYSTSLQGDLNRARLPIQVRALCPDVVATDMVSAVAKDPGAAMLFSGPKPLDAAGVVSAGLELLDSRQLFRVVPRWRGALVRGIDLTPSVGVRLLGVMRAYGTTRQRH